MSTVFVGEAHPPQGDPDKMFTVRNPVPGEKAAGPVEFDRLQDPVAGLIHE